mmetsp:Transcript_86844/g.246278  ORF Transcript_86844/g.246278 Transcript_86844/m.246278 type:complete len:219 (+) Transcript_86844:74-730(+)
MAAVVVPGRKLLPDGSAPPILVARVRAAVQVCRDDPRIKLLVLSGGKMKMNPDELARFGAAGGPALPPTSEAEAMKNLALAEGLDPSLEVVLETESVHTVENAVNVRGYVAARGISRIVLVNSTFHMERLRRSFELVFDGLPIAFECVESSDEDLTQAEREREVVVEPAMLERLPAHARIYRRHMAGELTLQEARDRFFQAPEPHSDVWTMPIPDPEA